MSKREKDIIDRSLLSNIEVNDNLIDDAMNNMPSKKKKNIMRYLMPVAVCFVLVLVFIPVIYFNHFLPANSAPEFSDINKYEDIASLSLFNDELIAINSRYYMNANSEDTATFSKASNGKLRARYKLNIGEITFDFVGEKMMEAQDTIALLGGEMRYTLTSDETNHSQIFSATLNVDGDIVKIGLKTNNSELTIEAIEGIIVDLICVR